MKRDDDLKYMYAFNKGAMIAHKGGHCSACDKLITWLTRDKFHFHHREGVSNGHDKSDRWGGGGRFLHPFTPKWFAWADRVDLVCEECHSRRHREANQAPILDFLEFSAVQERLDNHAPGPMEAEQSPLFHWSDIKEAVK